MWWVILMTQLLQYSLLPSVLCTMVVWEMKTCSWLDSLKTISAGKRNGWKSVKNVVDGACGFDPTKKVPLFFFSMLRSQWNGKRRFARGNLNPHQFDIRSREGKHTSCCCCMSQLWFLSSIDPRDLQRLPSFWLERENMPLGKKTMATLSRSVGEI